MSEAPERISNNDRMTVIIDATARSEYVRADLYDSLVAALKDPATVWASMLRGTIARPQALDHYEELKAKFEAIQSCERSMRGFLQTIVDSKLPSTSQALANFVVNLRLDARNVLDQSQPQPLPGKQYVHYYAGWPGKTLCNVDAGTKPISNIHRETVTCPDCISLLGAQILPDGMPKGKPCTCDNCLGSSTSCRVEAGERLGDLWYCRKQASQKLSGDQS